MSVYLCLLNYCIESMASNDLMSMFSNGINKLANNPSNMNYYVIMKIIIVKLMKVIITYCDFMQMLLLLYLASHGLPIYF